MSVARALITSCALATGCDGSFAAFLDAVPARSPVSTAPLHVILGVDGISRSVFDQARTQGAFPGWAAADLVTVFPGTSDYAWTRTLGTAPLPGYEIEHYEPATDTVVNQGLGGVVEHGLATGLAGTLPCYARFDFLGDGTLWMARSYLDPEAALPDTLDALFDAVAARIGRQRAFLAYVGNVDVISHLHSEARALAALIEVARRVEEFRARHPGAVRFTLLSDHGNNHVEAELVDFAQALAEVGVKPVDRLADTDGLALAAIPVIHVRMSYVGLHTRQPQEVASRVARHPWAELVVAPLPDVAGAAHGGARYGIWSGEQRLVFTRLSDGTLLIDDPAGLVAIGVDLGGATRLSDREAFERTRTGPYPDLFHRIHGAFTHPAADTRADVIVSLPDRVASYGFALPGGLGSTARAGFHGGLGRAASLSVLATDTGSLPAAVRTDDLAVVVPDLVP